MKRKYLFLTGILVLLFVMGCSTISGIDISPPSWIKGTWTAYNGAVTFKFLSDNIIYTNRNGTTISFVKQYAGMQVTEQSNNAAYTVTIINLDTTIVYSFKLSEDQIIYFIHDNDTNIDNGLLTKENT